jgi:hypothetical protein
MEMDEGKRRSEQDRGAKAEALLRNPMFQEAFQVLEEKYMDAWKNSPVKATDDREKLFQMYQNLIAVKGHLEEVVNTGNLAKLETTLRR